MDKVTLMIISIVIAAAIVGFLALRFDAFRHWLVYAVSESESVFGSGTGKLKLRYAYNLAVKAFPVIAKLVPWNMFSKLVDEALEIMHEMAEHNENISAALNGKEEL